MQWAFASPNFPITPERNLAGLAAQKTSMREFDFLEPNTLAEALGLVNELGDECSVSGGGTAIILAMRQRILNPQALVSLGKLEELRRIQFDPRTGLSIGALARHADIANSPLVREHYPVIASMAARLANPQVRNRGTIGGSNVSTPTPPPTRRVAFWRMGRVLSLQARGVNGSCRWRNFWWTFSLRRWNPLRF